jgi:peptide/nickel transport system substrate-binding protein
VAGVRIVGEAFEDFWRNVTNVRIIVVYPIKELATRYAMVKNGEVDLSALMIDVFFQNVQKDPKLRLITAASPTHRCITMAGQWDPKSPWSDVRVREAASLAIDRKTLADIHTPGAGPIGTLGLAEHPETLPRSMDPYDPERAKKLLAEAGYPNGFHGGKFFPRNGAYKAYGEEVVNYWRAVGIEMETVYMLKAAWQAQRRAGKFKGETFLGLVMSSSTSERVTHYLSPPYWGGYPDVDAEWDRYNKSTDAAERLDSLKRVQKRLYEKRAFIYLTGASCPHALGSKVKGNPFRIQTPYPIWFAAPMEDLELKE